MRQNDGGLPVPDSRTLHPTGNFAGGAVSEVDMPSSRFPFGTRAFKIGTRAAGVIVLALSSVTFAAGCPSSKERRSEPVASAPRATDAYDAHVQALRKRAPEGFTIVVQKPFVVIGDEQETVVQRRARTVVKWSVDALKAEYFDKDPDRIIDVWLFRDDRSYRDHALALFGKKPTTPYGYYAEESNALVMNIATGGGTLVHEVVHAFMRTNFPGCPVWFNEGLGSLYEQSEDADGRPRGLLNWRLPGLQEAIADDRVPTIHELTSMDDDAFYGTGSGTHYGAARYLLYYLQERGLLQAMWRELRSTHGTDPTGFASLQRVLGETDMTSFEKRWRTWVSGLRWER